MANGDIAAGVGMDTVASTAKRKLGYDEINKTRDYLATHQTTGTHPASAITSGTLDIARIPTIPASKLSGSLGIAVATGLASEFGGTLLVSGPGITITNGASCGGSLSVGGGITAPAVYGTIISSAFRSLSVRSDGVFGWASSSRRHKRDIRPADLPIELLAQLQLVWFRYRQSVRDLGSSAPTELGLIAEEVHDLGLTWLVDYDDDGKPFGLRDRALAYVGIALGQHALAQQQLNAEAIAEMTERIEKLENNNA